MKKIVSKIYLYIFLLFNGIKNKTIKPNPIHLANTIGPPPSAAILPSTLSEEVNPNNAKRASKQLTPTRINKV